MDSLEITWWMWLIAGLVLMALEIATPGGFFIIFFGVGALIVGLLGMLGVEMPVVVEGIVFLLTSIVALMIFRKPLLDRFNKNTPHAVVDSIEGEFALAMEDIAPNGFGKAELRGTAWNAHNVGEELIVRSTRCKVKRVDGLTLQIRA